MQDLTAQPDRNNPTALDRPAASPAMSPADVAAHVAASHLSPRGIARLGRCGKALRKVAA